MRDRSRFLDFRPTPALALFAWLAVIGAQAAGAVPPDGTLPEATSWTDSVKVAAPKVTLEEIVADIGRRMRAERDSLESCGFTAVVTVAHSRDNAAAAADSGSWELEETAMRVHQVKGQPDRTVKLWSRKLDVVDGRPGAAKEEAAGKAEWQPRTGDLAAELPFAPGSASRYRYEKIESRLVGESLVHRVAFFPRSAFAALPSGEIWVDIADWSIRRVEVRFEGAVPAPWLVRAIPLYRQRQALCGQVWFPVEEIARIELRDVPFTDLGGTYDVRVQLRDIVINGVPCDCEEAGAGDNDQVSAFWSTLDDAWRVELPPPLRQPVGLAETTIDSLSREGSDLIAAMPATPPWRVSLRPLAPAYNRAQGFVPRAGARLGRTGGTTRLDVGGGWGTADHRVEWSAEAAAKPLSSLTLQAGASRSTGAFAGDGRLGWRSFTAALWGDDPNHYFDHTTQFASLAWRPVEALSLNLGGANTRDLPLSVQTDWNLAGQEPSPAGNRAADALDARTMRAGAALKVGRFTLDGGVARHEVEPRGIEVGGDPSSRTLNEWRAAGRWRLADGAGNRWTLTGGARAFDAPAPAQWRAWAGDWRPEGGSLCGWPAATLAGDRAAWSSLELDLNVDPWRALGVPLLKGLRLQPLLFAEWAGAWDREGARWPGDLEAAAADHSLGGAPVTGSRADLGLGFSRRVDLPLVGLGSRIELRVARPVGTESDGRPWRVLLGIGN